VYPVSNEPLDACCVVSLPLRVGGQGNVGGPSWHCARRNDKLVPDRLVPSAAAIKHPRQNRYIEIGVIIYSNLALSIVQAVQTSDILSNRSSPRDRHGEKQRIQTRIVKTLADIAARRQKHPLLVIRNGQKSGGDCLKHLSLHATAQHNQITY